MSSRELESSEPRKSGVLRRSVSCAEANSIEFRHLCQLLEKVRVARGVEAKLKLIFSPGLKKKLGGGSLYPILRLILPHLDRTRVYKIKESKLVDFYKHILGLNDDNADVQKLRNWNNPEFFPPGAKHGEFASVLEEVLQFRCDVSSSTLSLGDVHGLLDELSAAKINARRERILAKLATNLSSMDQKWLARIILKDLKLGIRHERMLMHIHPDAVDMFNHTNDLELICRELRNSVVRYAPRLIPFQTFSPMLAQRVEFSKCIHAMNCEKFAIEPKLDGERILCHVKAGIIKFLSRNCVDYSELYGEVGGMNKIIQDQIRTGVDCILDGEMMVWDDDQGRFADFGELKTVMKEQMGISKRTRWPCYIMWDIVYIGGENAPELREQIYDGDEDMMGITGLPLYVRRSILEKIIEPRKHRLELIEHKVVSGDSIIDKHRYVMEEVDNVVSTGGEGVILKDLTSNYSFGEASRKLRRWLKLKPDYAGITSNVDVLILGGYYSEGKRQTGDITSFLVGVLGEKPLDELNEDELDYREDRIPDCFTVSRVGNGFTDDDIAVLKHHLDPHWQVFDKNFIPSFLHGLESVKKVLLPDVWVAPHHSKVLEVMGFEITRTKQFGAGVTIRFPRSKAVRHDKNWKETTTLTELTSMRGTVFTNKRKAADIPLSQDIQSATSSISKKPRTKRKLSARNTVQLVQSYAAADVSNVHRESDLLRGYEFCILNVDEIHLVELEVQLKSVLEAECLAKKQQTSDSQSASQSESQSQSSLSQWNTWASKKSLEKLIFSKGGTCVQNACDGQTTHLLCSQDKGLRVNNIKRQQVFDIVHLKWLVRSLVKGQVMDIQEEDYVHITPATVERLKADPELTESFPLSTADSFSLHELRRSIKSRELAVCKYDLEWQCTALDLLNEEQEMLDSKWNIFWHCTVFICCDKGRNIETAVASRRIALRQLIKLYSGRISEQLTECVTHVVTVSTDLNSESLKQVFQSIRKSRRQQRKVPVVVKSDWVQDSVSQGKQLPVDIANYQLVG